MVLSGSTPSPSSDLSTAPRSLRPAAGSPRVAVVIPNWNGEPHLRTCLEALERQTLRLEMEVWVVDNGSTDGSVALVTELAWVKLIRNHENCGFAAACNQAIIASDSPFVALLNNDVVVAADWLERLLEVIVEAPRVGSCTSKVLNQTDPRVIDNCGHVLYADGLTRGRGRLEPDDGRFDRIEEVFCPSGCACLLRWEMLDDVGLFDEAFFAYCEDADLGFRGRLRGWSCLFVPAAVAYHRFSGSSVTAYSSLKALNVERNRLWLAVKNLPLPLLVMSVGATLARYAWQAVGALTHRGASGAFVRERSAPELMRILLASYRQGLVGLPRAWRQRRRIQARRTASILEILSWLRRFGVGARRIALLD